MADELSALLERARNHVITPEELAAQRKSFMRAMKEPCDDDLSEGELARRRAEADKLEPRLRWDGEGPAPARWTAGDGTIVYRSYADYCDD